MQTAQDVFVGYVMLDAWIANQDRHHENWAALRDDAFRLAPTYDHGAGFARNLTDAERKGRLETRDKNRTLQAFAARARSAFYVDAAATRPLGTLEAFSAFAEFAPEAKKAWLGRMAEIEDNAVCGIMDEVPDERMSRICKEFTLQLLKENRTRLCRELST